MATIPRLDARGDPTYPTSDGMPMAETDDHRQLMVDLIGTLQDRHAADPEVYASGNLLLFYEEGNRRQHVAPDVFVVFGVPRHPPRLNYIVWEEGKAPDVVIELTSKTTRKEDQEKKLALYRDVLRVPEYFLFDPTRDYLRPPLQGFRLAGDRYEPIESVAGRLPSVVLNLHLEQGGKQLRLFDPATGLRLPTRDETRQRAEAENERLRQELEELRRWLGGGA